MVELSVAWLTISVEKVHQVVGCEQSVKNLLVISVRS